MFVAGPRDYGARRTGRQKPIGLRYGDSFPGAGPTCRSYWPRRCPSGPFVLAFANETSIDRSKPTMPFDASFHVESPRSCALTKASTVYPFDVVLARNAEDVHVGG